MNNQNTAPHTAPHTATPCRVRRTVLTAMLVVGLGISTLNALAQSKAPATAPSTGPIVIQFSHVVSADTPKGKAALRFKELAESRTAGRVRVEVYANSSLYKDREELDALRLGAVQMLAPSLSKLAGIGGSDFEVFDLPFLFKDQAAFRKIADGAIGAQLLSNLQAKGVKGLAYWDNGFKVFTANRALQTPENFAGLRIRVQASKTLVSQMQQLKTDPSVSPLINVYEALRAGKLDGQENTPVNIYSQKLHEVQNHLTVSNHGYLAYAVIVNKAFWDKLPADLRGTLEGAMRDATAYEYSLSEVANSQALERIKASGKLNVITLAPTERVQWQRAMEPVYEASRAWINPQLLRSIQVATGSPP